jgi:hypothetical protein
MEVAPGSVHGALPGYVAMLLALVNHPDPMAMLR